MQPLQGCRCRRVLLFVEPVFVKIQEALDVVCWYLWVGDGYVSQQQLGGTR